VADSDLVFEWSRRFWLPISRSPRLFPAMVRLQRKRRNRPARAGDQIVIDGFPRSANTFSSRAFLSVNPGVTASHHMHAPANVLLAVKFEVPTIVVVRSPVDAVMSEVIREPRKRLRRGLLEWNSFYTTALPVLDRVVVGEFSTVTSDYSVVIDEVNRRFGTDFVVYHNGPESDAAVFDSIEAGARSRGKVGSRLETQVPRPSKERAGQKAALEAELERPELQSLVDTAQALYEKFLAVAPRSS
jgi:hypothetical protein